jgi:acyl-CoA thioester hydrolase
MAKYFQENITVLPEHLDDNNHVNNLVYLRWAQGISGRHWRADANEDDLENCAWVVAHQEITYLKEALIHDELIIKTWIEKAEGAKCYRHVEIIRTRDNTLLTTAIITWFLLDKKSRRPKRIHDTLMKNFIN